MPASGWTLGVRAAVWIVVFASLWVRSSAVGRRHAEHEARRERVRLLDSVAQRERLLAGALAVLPQAVSQDASWWQEFLASGLRSQGLKVSSTAPGAVRDALGTHRLVELSFTASGTYAQFVRTVDWLETARPRVRVESVVLKRPAQGPLSGRITLLAPVLAGVRKE
jgi:hypothetical protein